MKTVACILTISVLLLTQCDSGAPQDTSYISTETDAAYTATTISSDLHTTLKEDSDIRGDDRETAEFIIEQVRDFAALLDEDADTETHTDTYRDTGPFATITFENVAALLESRTHMTYAFVEQFIKACSDYDIVYYFGTSLFHKVLSGEITIQYDIEKITRDLQGYSEEFINDYFYTITHTPRESACFSLLEWFDISAWNNDIKGFENLSKLVLNTTEWDVIKAETYDCLSFAYYTVDDKRNYYYALDAAFPYMLNTYKKYKETEYFKGFIRVYLAETSNLQDHVKVKHILQEITAAGFDVQTHLPSTWEEDML